MGLSDNFNLIFFERVYSPHQMQKKKAIFIVEDTLGADILYVR